MVLRGVGVSPTYSTDCRVLPLLRALRTARAVWFRYRPPRVRVRCSAWWGMGVVGGVSVGAEHRGAQVGAAAAGVEHQDDQPGAGGGHGLRCAHRDPAGPVLGVEEGPFVAVGVDVGAAGVPDRGGVRVCDGFFLEAAQDVVVGSCGERGP